MAAKAKVVAGVAVLVLIACVAFMWDAAPGVAIRPHVASAEIVVVPSVRAEPRPAAPVAEAAAVPDDPPAPPRRAVAEAPRAELPRGERVAVAAAPGTATLRGRVLHRERMQPVGEIAVALSIADAGVRTVKTDARGLFEFDDVPDDRLLRLSLDPPMFAPIVVPSLRLDRDETRDVGVLLLDQAARFAVSVRDWAERPIAGAAVGVHYDAGVPGFSLFDLWSDASSVREATEPAAAATTDDSGRATFAALRPGRWHVVVSSPGYALTRLGPWTAAAGAASPEIVVRLDRGHVVTGRVIDAAGRPLAGVTVWAAGRDRWCADTAPHATTDSAGRFEIPSVPSGDATILAGRVGRSPAAVIVLRVPASGPVDVVLGRGTVRGRVTAAESGAPLPGARVRAYGAAESGSAAMLFETISSDDGSYVLDVPGVRGIFTFRVERPGFLLAVEHGDGSGGQLLLDDGAAVRDFALIRGARLAGRVLGPDGPLVGATVAAHWAAGGFIPRVEVTTGDDGLFTFPCVPPGAVVLRAFAPGFCGADSSMTWIGELATGRTPPAAIVVPAEGRDDAVVRLVVGPAPSATPSARHGLAPTIHVRGRVSTAVGTVPAETTVEILGPQPGAPSSVSEFVFNRVRVGPDGQFDAPLSAAWRPSRLRVRARAQGSAQGVSAYVALPSGATGIEVDVVLVEAVELVGRVVRAADAGAPVARARVSIRTGDAPPGASDADAVAAVTDADGRFRIPEVPAGPLTVSVVADGFALATASIRAPADGEVTLALEQALDIAGSVRLADGTPVRSVFVSIYREDAASGGANWWSTPCTADGRFRLRGLRAGSYWLGVSPAPANTMSFRRYERKGVIAGTDDLAVVLELAGVIRGRVVDDRGRPLAGASVVARSETGDRFTPSAQSARDGTFAITGLAADTFSVVARPPEVIGDDRGVAKREWLAARVTGVAADGDPLEIRLARGLEIRGRLDGASGTPLAGAWVRADPGTGTGRDDWLYASRPCGAETDAAGAFGITGLPPGDYQLSLVTGAQGARLVLALHGGAAVTAGSTEVRLRAGETRPIRGVVLDERGAPVARASVTVSPFGGGAAFSSRTDSEGRFGVPAVSDAVRYGVDVEMEGLVPARLAHVAAGSLDLRIELRRGLEAAGRLLSADGGPAKSVDLRFTAVADGREVRATTDADGRFVARGLEDGVWRVVLRTYAADGDPSSTPCGEIRAGDRDVDLRAER